MNPAIWWGIVVLVLIGSEMFTGTFYLLMLAIGAIAGAGAALIGLDIDWQILIASITAIVTTGLLHIRRYKNPRAANYTENKDAIIDIGGTVEVAHWSPEHTTQVKYRGATWSARWAGQGQPQTGHCIIRGMKGSQLQLDIQQQP